MLQKIFIAYKYCSFELSIVLNPEKSVSLFP